MCNAKRNLERAYQNFFKYPKTGFPKFKSKKYSRKSYTTNRMRTNIRIENGCIRLPKIGFVKLKQHRQIPSDYILKSVTVSQTPTGKYYVSILFEYENQVQNKVPQSFLGLDYAMHGLYKGSNKKMRIIHVFIEQAEKKLKREQRKLSKMEKGSKNRKKQRLKVAKMYERITNQRKDFLHKKSRQIASAYDCVCIEDLNMQALAKSLYFGKSVCSTCW